MAVICWAMSSHPLWLRATTEWWRVFSTPGAHWTSPGGVPANPVTVTVASTMARVPVRGTTRRTM